MYLARELTEHSLPEIGRGIGGRNHTTVLHAVNRVGAAMHSDDPDAQRGRQPPPAARPARVMTGVNGRINSFPTGSIPLPKPDRPGCPPLNSPNHLYLR